MLVNTVYYDFDKWAYGGLDPVLLWRGLLKTDFSNDIPDYFADTVTIVQLPQCQKILRIWTNESY